MTSERPHALRVVYVAMIACAVALCGGCASDPADAPPPRLEPLAPGAEPTEMLLSVEQPVDTNANGCVDAFRIVLYLFEPDASVLSLWSEGRLVVYLILDDSKKVARWEFDETALRAGRQKLPPGPGYVLTMSLLDTESGDTFPSQPADVLAEFTTPKGTVVRRSVGGIRIGGRKPGG
ncbi:MAG: hypothetical protein RBS39_11240 [Phycisphaerales bacterium]|jgi:hypothetical protein|nr:hypothetical protein [Phycisphaerales bacterium]